MIVLAHRGLRRHGPENTLSGMRGVALAAASGVPLGVELDARRTADGVLLAVHDSMSLTDHPLSRSGKFHFCDNWYASAQAVFGDECPPRLEEMLEVVADVPAVDIDIKERGYTAAVIEAASTIIPPERLMISSHIPEVILEAREHLPDGALTGMSISEYWHFDDEELVRLVTAVQADFLFLEHIHATAALIDRLHDMSKRVGVYTVNERDRLHELIEMGVDFPCTDFPEMAIVELETLVAADEIVLNASQRQTA